MAAICTCGHSTTDHLTGRCVNRTMRFNAASGGTVANKCGCKKFTAAAVESAVPAVEEAAAAEPITESDEDAVATMDVEPPRKAPAVRAHGGRKK